MKGIGLVLSKANKEMRTEMEEFFLRHKLMVLMVGSVLLVGAFCFSLGTIAAADRNYQQIVVFGDPHLPGRIMESKEAALQHVVAWPDVDAVVVVGDLSYDTGTESELNEAKRFFSRINTLFYAITGNHDVMYADAKSADGKRIRTSPAERNFKLERFVAAFNLPGAFYSKQIGNYLLVFLSIDDPTGKYLAEMSDAEVGWLRSELAKHRDLPTIIFFHSPLEGTLTGVNDNINMPNFIAQPKETVRNILRENPQVRLWVSGHTHTGAINANYNSPVNLYEGRVLNVHTPDMDGRSYLSETARSSPRHNTVWTNSLFLYPDRIVIKTFDHNRNSWMEELTRTVLR